MQFWIARHSEIPVREQLVTQFVLAILSGDLAPEQRLPSTRELARRFHLHPNTISAAYRQLEHERWVEFRHGSGVYVRGSKPDGLTSTLELDQLIANLFRSAREIGAPMSAVRAGLRNWLAMQPPDHFLVIEPDTELRRIVVAEVQKAVSLTVEGADLSATRSAETIEGAVVLALPSKFEAVRRALPPGTECLRLHPRSVPASLAAYLPAPSDALIGIASRWTGFLNPARTMLIAAGFHADSLVVCDARSARWRTAVKGTVAVICDILTAAELPKSSRAIPFAILSDATTAELKRYQQFLSQPLNTRS